MQPQNAKIVIFFLQTAASCMDSRRRACLVSRNLVMVERTSSCKLAPVVKARMSHRKGILLQGNKEHCKTKEILRRIKETIRRTKDEYYFRLPKWTKFPNVRFARPH